MAEIIWDNIVGDKDLTNGGYIGDLMAIARVHIEDAKKKNEITHAEAGQVYAAMIPAAFQEGIQADRVLAEAIVTAQKIVGRKQ